MEPEMKLNTDGQKKMLSMSITGLSRGRRETFGVKMILFCAGVITGWVMLLLMETCFAG